MVTADLGHERDCWTGYAFLGLVAVVLAFVSSRPFIGGWNDGSRLATVDSLVERHTLAIDDSLFVKVPQRLAAGEHRPYGPGEPCMDGTKDKLLIGGRYYSDKSPVLQLWLAGCYQVWRWCGGPTVREQYGLFCRVMTLLSCGVAYVIAVLCVFRLSWHLALPRAWRWLWTGSFALATIALPYVRHVNAHLPQLAVTAALFVQLAWLVPVNRQDAPPLSRWRLAFLGSLAGLAYTLDLGVGPALLLCLAPLVLYRCRRWDLLWCAVLGAVPWLVLHHAVNYAVAGTWLPANMVIEYLQWPGSPFNQDNATGKWKHDLPGFLYYAAKLWIGRRGFLNYNLVLLLALPGLGLLRDRACAWRPELLFGVAWALLCGLLYGALSNNYSGSSLSTRWFAPLLIPMYLLVGVLIRDRPAFRELFLLLTFWGAILAVFMWHVGPFKRSVPYFSPVQAAALASLLGWCLHRWWRKREFASFVPPARCTAVQQVG